jgi:hypothetical protein
MKKQDILDKMRYCLVDLRNLERIISQAKQTSANEWIRVTVDDGGIYTVGKNDESFKLFMKYMGDEKERLLNDITYYSKLWTETMNS